MTQEAWPKPIGIIGGGAVGAALTVALRYAALSFVGVGTRDASRVAAWLPSALVTSPEAIVATAKLVFLTVPDSALLATARAHSWRADQWVAHCAGAMAAEVLAEAVAPAQAVAFHPLAAFTRPGSTPPPVLTTAPLAGFVVALDGPETTLEGLYSLASRLQMRPLRVTAAARPAYHLAASLASNMLVALIAEAVEIWRVAGLDPTLALPALLPLIASTEANLARVGLPDALTGPIARGDVATIARHLDALATPDLAPIAATYRLLGQRAVALALTQGHADPEHLKAIAELLARDTP